MGRKQKLNSLFINSPPNRVITTSKNYQNLNDNSSLYTIL